MKADSILMHKEKNIIAVRAAQGESTVVQVFDMEGSKKITQVQIADSAVYWRWIGLNKLAVVGKTSVWHIDATQQVDAVKMFDRAPQLAPCQIMSYDVDSAEQWCFLVGLYSPD